MYPAAVIDLRSAASWQTNGYVTWKTDSNRQVDWSW